MATLKPVPAEAVPARAYAAQIVRKMMRERLERRLPNLYRRAFWFFISRQEPGVDDEASSKDFRMALFSVRFGMMLSAHVWRNVRPGPNNPWDTFHPPVPVTHHFHYLNKTNVFAQKLKAEKNRCLALRLIEPQTQQHLELMQAVDDYLDAFAANTNPSPTTSDPIYEKRRVLLDRAEQAWRTYDDMAIDAD